MVQRARTGGAQSCSGKRRASCRSGENRRAGVVFLPSLRAEQNCTCRGDAPKVRWEEVRSPRGGLLSRRDVPRPGSDSSRSSCEQIAGAGFGLSFI